MRTNPPPLTRVEDICAMPGMTLHVSDGGTMHRTLTVDIPKRWRTLWPSVKLVPCGSSLRDGLHGRPHHRIADRGVSERSSPQWIDAEYYVDQHLYLLSLRDAGNVDASLLADRAQYTVHRPHRQMMRRSL